MSCVRRCESGDSAGGMRTAGGDGQRRGGRRAPRRWRAAVVFGVHRLFPAVVSAALARGGGTLVLCWLSPRLSPAPSLCAVSARFCRRQDRSCSSCVCGGRQPLRRPSQPVKGQAGCSWVAGWLGGVQRAFRYLTSLAVHVCRQGGEGAAIVIEPLPELFWWCHFIYFPYNFADCDR